MPASRLVEYTVWIALADGTPEPVADYRLETDHRGRHRASGLRYRSGWLEHPRSYALNPVHAPLTSEVREWTTDAIPAVLDEVLPGRWERAVQRRFRGERHPSSTVQALLRIPAEARAVNDRLLAALEGREAVADSLGLAEHERHLFLR